MITSDSFVTSLGWWKSHGINRPLCMVTISMYWETPHLPCQIRIKFKLYYIQPCPWRVCLWLVVHHVHQHTQQPQWSDDKSHPFMGEGMIFFKYCCTTYSWLFCWLDTLAVMVSILQYDSQTTCFLDFYLPVMNFLGFVNFPDYDVE